MAGEPLIPAGGGLAEALVHAAADALHALKQLAALKIAEGVAIDAFRQWRNAIAHVLC